MAKIYAKTLKMENRHCGTNGLVKVALLMRWMGKMG